MRRLPPIPVLVAALAGLAGLPVHGLRRSSPQGSSAESPQAVPFYMYDLPKWTANCGGRNRGSSDMSDRVTGYYHQNEFPDVALYEVLKDHPWRVTNGSKAMLFVVPGYFSASLNELCGDHRENMQEVAEMLKRSPYFRQSRGRDHLISAFEYQMTPRNVVQKFADQMRSKFIVLHCEKDAFKRSLVVPYGPASGRGVNIEQVPPAKRRHSLFFMGQANSKYAYRTRRRALRYLPAAFPDSVLIQATQGFEAEWDRRSANFGDDTPDLKTPLPPCNATKTKIGCQMPYDYKEYIELGRQSNYSLFIHGDTPSSSRLYDTLQFGQVPIVISDKWRKVAMPFPEELPWDDFVVFVSQASFVENATAAIKAAMAKVPMSGATWELVQRVRPLLDWHHGGHCIGTAVLSSAARQYLGMKGLPPALNSPYCSRAYLDSRPPAALPHLMRAPRGPGLAQEETPQEPALEQDMG